MTNRQKRATRRVAGSDRPVRRRAGEDRAAIADVGASGAVFREGIELWADWYWEQDDQFRFTYRSLGYHGDPPDNADFLGKKRWEIKDILLNDAQWAEHKVVLEAHQPFRQFEFCRQLPDGQCAWFSVSGLPVFSNQGAFVGYRGIAFDITRHKQVEAALRASEEKFSKAFHSSPDWIVISKRESAEFLEVNEGFTRISGYSREEAIGRTSLELDIWQQPEQRAALVEKLASGELVRDVESVYRRKSGEEYVLLISIDPIDLGGEKCILTVGRDITEKKRVEAGLRNSTDRLREVSRRLAHVQEAERRQVAGDLHDSMGRDLTALVINLDLIRARLPAEVLPGIEARLDDARELVSSAMQTVRSLVAGLRPPLLEEWGLVPALRSYAAEFSKRSAVPVEVVATENEARLRDEVEVALFRVAQEALLNCAKHARAGQIDISVEAAAGHVTLTIADDGVGCVLEDTASGGRAPGLGLALMRERIEAVGGSLHVVSSPERGTRITAVIER